MTTTYTLTRDEALATFGIVKSHIAALHNWTASRIERGDLAGAQELVKEIRQFQEIYARLNVEAREDIERMKITVVKK